MSKRRSKDPAPPDRLKGTDAPDESRPDAPQESIEMLDYQAVDEAGVPLPEDEVVVDLDDTPTGGRDSSPERAAPGITGGAQLAAAQRERQEADQRATDLREQLLRTAADFDNYRKRLERERVEERKNAAAGLVRQLLPIMDNLRRAIEQARALPASTALGGFIDGIGLVDTQLTDVLSGAGLERIATDGEFDPAVHEAMMQEATTSAPHLTILEVFEPGYLFNGRLLRPARVKVAFNPESRAAASAGNGASEPPAD